MEYEDRMTISTPEGVTLEVTLAGVGSRLTAAFLDGLIQLVVLGALIWLAWAAFPDPSEDDELSGFLVIFAIINALIFIVLFSYHALFESLSSGRTPGKRAAGLRVVRIGGRPIDAKAAVIRNLMRLVDILPGAYGVGMIAILVTRRNQRLGDLVAGTVVIKDRNETAVAPRPPQAWTPELGTWDVTGISVTDLAIVHRFLGRREELTAETRARIADEIADRLRPKVVGAPALPAEAFLEHLAACKSARI